MQRLRARGAIHKLTAAIGADIVKFFGAWRAEGAFEAANERARRFGGQISAATFAVGAHVEHFAILLSRRANRVAHSVDDLFDLRRIVTLGHHADHGLCT